MWNFLRQVRRKWGYSIVGLWTSFKEEKSLVAYIVIAIGLIGFGIYAKLSYVEWILLVLIISLIITIEIINTSLEATVDAISFQYNVKIKKIKNIASAATLIMTLGGIICIVLIFLSAFQK